MTDALGPVLKNSPSRSMAMLTLRPLVVDFIDTTMYSRGRELVLENIKVGSGSPAMGVTVREGLQCCGALAILTVRKENGRLINKIWHLDQVNNVREPRPLLSTY